MFAVMATTAVGQTQQGYVKTRGKLAADGKSIVPGVRLSNALVTIENLSPVKSGANGAFSFALPAGTNHYRLQGAELKGYTLADPDAIRQTHTYSKDLPLIVVLEDMKQREADLEAARKSVRNTLKREIRKKQDELDSLRDVHAITQAKYDSLVRDFWEYRQSSEKLVNEMAERYVSTDYDQLDDFNRRVQAYIESGQLTKADSMIRTKGSLEERFLRVKQYEAANAQRTAEIQQEQEALDRSRQFTHKEKMDLANDLYRQHLIFLQQPQMQDSALYCMKLRADLDTTNIDAVRDYALLSHSQKAFHEAEKYYKIVLRNYKKHYAANPEAYHAASATIQNNLGILYSDLNDYAASERYYKQALENGESLYAANPEAYRASLATTQSNLGCLYSDLHDYASSERYFKLALENREKLFSANPAAYRADLANTQNGLGNLYMALHDYANSEKYLIMALENKKKLYAVNPEAYLVTLATTQNNLGNLYSDLHDNANSEKYYKLALENKKKLYAANSEAYRADLAATQYNLGRLYYNLHDYANSEKYYKLALGNYERLFSTYPEVYRANLAMTQNNLGYLYRILRDYAASEKYYKLALGKLDTLNVTNPGIYRANLALNQYNLGTLYRDLQDYATSVKYYKLALNIWEKLSAANSEAYRGTLASTQYYLGTLYSKLHDYAASEQYYKLALGNYEKLYAANSGAYRAILVQTQNGLAYLYVKLNDYVSAISIIDEAISLTPEDANLYDSKGEILLMQGKEQEALKMWQKVLELNPKFLDDYPKGTNLSNGLKANGLIK